MRKLFVIDLTRGYLPASLLTAAAYADQSAEAMLVQASQDHEAVRVAVDRLRPELLLAMPGTAQEIPLGRGGEDRVPMEPLPSESAPLLAWLISQAVDDARGVVMFPAHSPSWAIKATSLAVRLGYLAWPLEEAAGFAYAAPPEVPILLVGEAPGSVADLLQGREFRHLPGDRAIAQYLQEKGVQTDYIVLVNSADLEPPTYTSPGLASHWTRGLSLLAPLLASYRNAQVIDARAPRADAREVERTLNQKVLDTGLQPEFLAILASPGAIPFIYEPQLSFKGGEEYTREIHLRRNQDLLFDVAEGRLFGKTAGTVSLQLLTTKHFARMEGGFKEKVLITGRPHVEGGVIFAIDEAAGRSQLTPLLTGAGLGVTELYGTDCSPERLGPHLRNSGLFIYGGHGSQEALSTHEAPLYPEFLPTRLPPGVVYACACSTLYPRPARHTADGGFSFDEEPTPYPEQIGPAFIDRGSLAFVGGLTAEDVLLNTGMYVVFTQALTLDGLSVGQAVRAARNHALVQLGVLAQTAPRTAAEYRLGLANAVQQQLLLGDPAFAPFRPRPGLRLSQEVTAQEGRLSIAVSLPADRWKRVRIPVDPGQQNAEFHRARTLETRVPVADGVVIWGENYSVARDAEGISETGLMGAYLRLSVDLPPGRVPVALTLDEVESGEQECLLCGGTHPAGDEALDHFRSFVIPFLGRSGPVRQDHSRGWGFVTEEVAGGLRIHWLVPALVVLDSSRQAVELRRARFSLSHAPGVLTEGRIDLPPTRSSRGAPGAMEGTRGLLPDDILLTFRPAGEDGSAASRTGPTVAQTLAGPGGRWACWLQDGAELAVRADPPFPVFRHGQDWNMGYSPEARHSIKAGAGPATISLGLAEIGTLRGVVLDGVTGKPLSGSRVRIWRGKALPEGQVLEGFAGEAKADAQGRFEVALPVGSYVVSAAHRTDLRYRTGQGAARVYPDREASLILVMEPGAVISGRVQFQGRYTPKRVTVKLLEYGSEKEKVVAQGQTRRDGRFELLAPTSVPFTVRIQPEGYRPLLDDNAGAGYHLAPGEELERTYQLVADE